MARMNRLDALGLFAGMLTTIAFLPQVMRTWRTRRTDDISLVMLVMFSAGVGLWIVYGVLMKSLPIIAANIATLFFILFILRVKLQNRSRRP